MNSQEQLKQQQTSLLEQAASHGPYLWSSRDIQNALQWFAPASANTRHGDIHGREDVNGTSGGCEFLRRLIDSPGIHSLRPKKRVSKRGNDDKTKASEATAGKKRKRDSDGHGSAAAKSDDVLANVLKGYYQLFLAKDTTQRQHGSNETPRKDQGTADSANAEMASTQLQNDLNAIILSRLRTNEMYNAILEQTTDNEQSDIVPKGLQMNTRIDEYMTHPTTAILRAYTSNLYDRYKTLAEGDKERFIQKLLWLAEDDVKVQQVVLLFLLEPLRRLYVERLQASICNKKAENTQVHQEMASKILLYPLLTSNVTWSDIPTEKIEEECNRQPMQQIIDYITESASSKLNNMSVDRRFKTANVRICWWSLPSPLLCFVSQLYFPLACGYIRYLIKAAIIEHDNLYMIDTTTKSIGAGGAQSSSEEGSFESVMIRIQQFSQTSQRLESLAFYIMSVIEEENLSQRKNDNMIKEGEEPIDGDDATFRQRLAWKAIRRRLDM